jgi:hypothetical protein
MIIYKTQNNLKNSPLNAQIGYFYNKIYYNKTSYLPLYICVNEKQDHTPHISKCHQEMARYWKIFQKLK